MIEFQIGLLLFFWNLARIIMYQLDYNDGLVPKQLPVSTVQRVLQNLLEEGVNIRDMRTIIEVLAEHGAKVTEAGDLAALVRVALGRAIVQQLYPGADIRNVVVSHSDTYNRHGATIFAIGFTGTSYALVETSP